MLQLGDDTAAASACGSNEPAPHSSSSASRWLPSPRRRPDPVAFVAFVAAPIARRLVGAPLTIVPAALTGALLLLASDLVGRRMFAPTELPVGVVTGLVGAPYLLWLLARANPSAEEAECMPDLTHRASRMSVQHATEASRTRQLTT
jgi:iron complex transport system permease protein